MSTASRREKTQRGYHWIAPPAPNRPYGIVRLAIGQSSFEYFVQAIPADVGRAFKLTLIDGTGAVVHQVVLNGKASACNCNGGKGGCEHIALLSALLSAGELPGPPAPAR